MKLLKHIALAAAALVAASASATVKTVVLKQNANLQRSIVKLVKEKRPADTLVVRLTPAYYMLGPDHTVERTLFISNHDQDNPKRVWLPLEGAKNVVIDGQGAEFVFSGRVLPVVLSNCENVTLSNFSIDFDNPHVAQAVVVANNPEAGTITYRPEPWVKYRITPEGEFVTYGEGWEHRPWLGIAFEEGTKHVTYRTGDIRVGTEKVREVEPGLIEAPWKDARLIPGTRLAMRTGGRPTPGIFMAECRRTTLRNVKVHYCEGMGLLAQLCEDIDMDGFGVCLRGDADKRYFTSQADATHFSGCKGQIRSVNGLYEGMMDDAINVHGTYLRITSVTDSATVRARYMHDQSYGFKWGEPGDTVQLIASRTMENRGPELQIVKITPIDTPTNHGVKEFEISFNRAVAPYMEGAGKDDKFGLENLTWSPSVLFDGNIIRNNRARGALFSTPRKVVCSNNLFDHTSGTAILLCGDCNGWFETGACRDVTITRNRFVNALTSLYQFTEAVISIYPEIPDLAGQQKKFHSGITITDNEFITFDLPLLYAKSVSGLVYRNNTVTPTTDYAPYHRRHARISLEKVDVATLSD